VDLGDLVGVEPVAFSSALSAKAQEAALMMARNETLSHGPPSSWACYTGTGASAAVSAKWLARPDSKVLAILGTVLTVFGLFGLFAAASPTIVAAHLLIGLGLLVYAGLRSAGRIAERMGSSTARGAAARRSAVATWCA